MYNSTCIYKLSYKHVVLQFGWFAYYSQEIILNYIYIKDER